MDIRRIDDRISVSPQITADDVATLKAQGFTTIVNNRPEGEEAGQPTGDAIAGAAAAAGMAYHAIPITHAGFSHPQLDAMATVLGDSGGPILAYCRSGTRSCNLWALASAKTGGDPDTLVAAGGAAGYDLSGIRPTLDALSQG
ncbi:TIGR01244 family sulfur transferase [Sphingomonas sp. 2R-10]|uniref:TIGR01244 family sulfur transferase n=1 Tax=Sphingomonas sp. 2R-10 TaxID=3045148 RepID=UPI000F7A1BB1|nr:TIGR01244 family sulfur transferase [Sphingomonas sp. 2R-10]MDJ0278224.1 TIGR01244 family sulfur transferase [Sphingomonas sp. 2R-10]